MSATKALVARINDLNSIGRVTAWVVLGFLAIVALLVLYWLVWIIGFMFHLWGDFGR